MSSSRSRLSAQSGTVSRALLLTTAATLCLLARTAAPQPKPKLTVRVDASTGSPRLLVNGRPRRARIFWGAPSPGLITLPETPAEVTYGFTPSQDEPGHATMHFRFGHTPGDVVLDDIRVTDLTTGKDALPLCDFEVGQAGFAREWHVWPPGEQNTVGTVAVEPQIGRGGTSGLHVRIRRPPSGEWPDFHIYHEANLSLARGHRYRVSFWVGAQPGRDLNTGFYRPGTTYVYLGGPAGHFESQVRLAAGAGVDLVSFEVPLVWSAPGEVEDWRAVDSLCENVLRTNPRALMIPRIPVYAPEWWKRANPDELMRWEDGLHAGLATPASEQFRRDAADRLEALVRHLESRFGEHMAGYHPTGQNTGEWFYADTWERPLNGYGARDAVAFREWLRKRYGSTAALRGAWNDPSVEFETAAVPPPSARHAAPNGVFRDPARERPLVDFAQFQQDSMADCVAALARAVRSASGGRKLVLFFYGYLFEFGAVPTGPAVSGHYALRRVLECPDIDVLCSPISYFDRGPLGSAPCMSAAESVALAGKMWLNEDDTRTYRTREKDFPGGEHVVSTLLETNGELIRNVAQEALRNFATWWMDLMGSGWFDDPGMWAEMKRLAKLDDALLARPIRFRPEVAAVIDEKTMSWIAAGGEVVTRPCVYESRAALGRMGSPYGQYLLDDLIRGPAPARLLVFTNTWRLSTAERNALRQAVRGRTAVWCYAPGWIDGDRVSLQAMRELTGFRCKVVSPAEAWAAPTAAGRRLGLSAAFGAHARITPVFAVEDADPKDVLAVYPDGSAAVVLRRTAEGSALFVGAPGLTAELLRIAARAAGVHLYTQQDCCVYANGPFLAIHAIAGGPVRLDVGQRQPVIDVLSGQVVGRGPVLSVAVRAGQNRILRVGRDPGVAGRSPSLRRDLRDHPGL